MVVRSLVTPTPVLSTGWFWLTEGSHTCHQPIALLPDSVIVAPLIRIHVAISQSFLSLVGSDHIHDLICAASCRNGYE